MSKTLSPETQIYISFLVLSGLGTLGFHDLKNPEVSKLALVANELRIKYLYSSEAERLELLQMMSESLTNVESVIATVKEHIEKETQKINSSKALNSEKEPA